jgi:hypothetical protein
MVVPLAAVKGFDWHPTTRGRFVQMEHFDPPRPAALITVVQLSPEGGVLAAVASATGDRFHHYLAWTADGQQIALGDVAACTTTLTLSLGPLP